MPQFLIDDEDNEGIPRQPDPIPTPTPPPGGGPDASTGQGSPAPPPSDPYEEPTARARNRGRDEGYPGMGGPVFRNVPVPVFRAPEFTRPTLQDVYNEPGYQFRVRAGQEGLERSAAARGVLRTGGTLRDISEYNQNFASNEYGQVFNRALNAFDRRYQGARDAFAPSLAAYQALMANEKARSLAAYNREWDAYTFARRGGGGGGGRPDPIEAPPDPNTYMPGADVGVPAAPGAPTKFMDERPAYTSGLDWERYY